MFTFFTKKNIIRQDFSVLGTDLHSHLIPGIDDGAPDLETSIALIRAMWEMGYKKIITTPHVMGEYYPNSSNMIKEGLEKVKKALIIANIPVDLYASAEYHADENFESLIRNDDLLPFPGNQLLFELSFYGAPPGIEQIIFTLRTKGYNLILAHPERYPYYHGKMEALEHYKYMGCAFQLNILSLTGHYGEPIKKWAEKLLKADMIDYLGTDLHHERHARMLNTLLPAKQMQKILQNHDFKNKSL